MSWPKTARLGKKHSVKTKQKIREKSLLQFKNGIPVEIRKKMSKNNARYWTGKKFSKKHIENLRKAKKGKKLSEQHKLKLKGHTAWNKGLSSPMKGKKDQKLVEKKIGDGIQIEKKFLKIKNIGLPLNIEFGEKKF